MKNSPAGAAYLSACQREQADCALELLNALNNNAREVQLNHRARPLVDSDILCIADALRSKHTLRVLNLEENAFSLPGVQSLIDALVSNPGCVRELRLGKNRLRDPAVVILGNALALNGAGLKVLDVSENSVTKLGVVPLCQALSSKFCDLVEVSLHNNALEADAALPLSQAMRQSNKLKHLHLGYNSLRDSGAVQIARSIPIASSLATLDLTANRIGPQGGMEIAKALLSPNCTLQRINLRHNNFDDETFEFFGDVIVKNTSLTQIFLGFMRPSREVAAQVIATLKYNRSIVLFDLYGWGIEPNDAWGILEPVLDANTTLRAIITESCGALTHHIDSANNRREDAGLHRIYVGPEDRLAYQAAAAAKATSLARTQSQPAGSGTPEPPPYQTSRSASAAAAGHTAASAANNNNRNATQPPASRAIGSTTPRGEFVTPVVHSGTYDKDVDVLLQELQDVHMDSELRRKLVYIISQLQVKIDTLRSYHQQQLAVIEERVRACEQRPLCPHATGGELQQIGQQRNGAWTASQTPPHEARHSSIAPSARDASPVVRTDSFRPSGSAVVAPPPADAVPVTRANISPNRSGRFDGGASSTKSISCPIQRKSAVGGPTDPLDETQSPARRTQSDIPRGPITRPISPPARESSPPRRTSVGAEPEQTTQRSPRASPRRGRDGAQEVHQTARPGPLAGAPGRGPGRPPAYASREQGGRSASYSEGLSGSTNVRSSSNFTSGRSSSVYIPPSQPPVVGTPPSEPVDMRDESPANALLQPSQYRPPTTFIEASPLKQDHPTRKQPPMNA